MATIPNGSKTASLIRPCPYPSNRINTTCLLDSRVSARRLPLWPNPLLCCPAMVALALDSTASINGLPHSSVTYRANGRRDVCANDTTQLPRMAYFPCPRITQLPKIMHPADTPATFKNQNFLLGYLVYCKSALLPYVLSLLRGHSPQTGRLGQLGETILPTVAALQHEGGYH